MESLRGKVRRRSTEQPLRDPSARNHSSERGASQQGQIQQQWSTFVDLGITKKVSSNMATWRTQDLTAAVINRLDNWQRLHVLPIAYIYNPIVGLGFNPVLSQCSGEARRVTRYNMMIYE